MVVMSTAILPSVLNSWPSLLLFLAGIFYLSPLPANVHGLGDRCSCVGEVSVRLEQRHPNRRSAATACMVDVGTV